MNRCMMITLASIFITFACGEDQAHSPDVPKLTGTFSVSLGIGSYSTSMMVIVENSGSLNGTFQLFGIGATRPIAGTVSTNGAIAINTVSGDDMWSFTGYASSDRRSLTGLYQHKEGNILKHGTFTAKKQ
ncbi:MAG: hypothetical protein M5R41_19130 [Bacteroidia bacterium]|nr:hypothetical protein [Bacteroidia bacterium]